MANLDGLSGERLQETLRQKGADVANKGFVNSLKSFLGIGDENKGPESARENRISEQAALILTMDDILTRITKEENVSSDISAKTKQYKNFTPIRVEDTGHFFITKNLTKTPAMNYFFSKLPPQILSLLLPSIKIYKTFYPFNNEPNKQNDKNNAYDWQVPFDNVPMSFNNDKETSGFVITSPEDVLGGNGGFRGAGIKSFSYKYKGVNPAEINTNIEARLELFFQSPAELIQKIQFGFDDPRFIQSAIKELETNVILDFSYSDLINQSSRRFRDPATGQEKHNDQYYRLKIECGYADVDIGLLEDILSTSGLASNSEDTAAVLSAIKASKVVLFLSPYKYDVKFNENSTVNLTIDFIAAMDNMMISNEADIFMLTEESRKLEKIEKEFSAFLVDNVEAGSAEAKKQDSDPCFDKGQMEQKINKFKEDYKTLLPKGENSTNEEIKALLSEYRAKAYNSISEFLVGKEDIHKNVPSAEIEKMVIRPKVYVAALKPDILGIVSGDKKEPGEIIKRRNEAFKNGNQVISVKPAFLESEATKIASAVAGEEDKYIKALDEKVDDSIKEQYNIKFVLLGDILDIALDVLDKIQPAGDAPKFVIGSLPMVLPTGEPQTFGSKVVYDGKDVFPNLADIPISFNLFQEFMIKHIVKAKKTRYPLLQFLKDIIAELVAPAITPTILGVPNAVRASIRFSTAYFTFPSPNGENLLAGGMSLEDRTYLPAITDKILQKIEGKNVSNAELGRPKQTEKKSTPFLNYIFLYCSGRFPRNITGDEDDDIKKKGILHLRMGTDTGIVKKINFSRVDIPYQREMLARLEGKGQGTNLKQFYNAEVELFGNDIFRPGDFIYIHPNYMFLASGKGEKYIDLQDSLGIGGYYLVIDVETNISNMAYSTKLKCSFQAQKTMTNSGPMLFPINDPCRKVTKSK